MATDHQRPSHCSPSLPSPGCCTVGAEILTGASSAAFVSSVGDMTGQSPDGLGRLLVGDLGKHSGRYCRRWLQPLWRKLFCLTAVAVILSLYTFILRSRLDWTELRAFPCVVRSHWKSQPVFLACFSHIPQVLQVHSKPMLFRSLLRKKKHLPLPQSG